MQNKIYLNINQEKLDLLKELADSKNKSFNEIVNNALDMYELIESNINRTSVVFIHKPKKSDKDLILPLGKHVLGLKRN